MVKSTGEPESIRYRQAAKLLTVSMSLIMRWIKPGPHGELALLTVYEIGGRKTARLKRAEVLALTKPRQVENKQ